MSVNTRKERSAEEKIALINDVYERFYKNTDSFDDQMSESPFSNCYGTALAYVLGSIADDSFVCYDEGTADHRFLKLYFPHDHAVWEYVEIEESEV